MFNSLEEFEKAFDFNGGAEITQEATLYASSWSEADLDGFEKSSVIEKMKILNSVKLIGYRYSPLLFLQVLKETQIHSVNLTNCPALEVQSMKQFAFFPELTEVCIAECSLFEELIVPLQQCGNLKKVSFHLPNAQIDTKALDAVSKISGIEALSLSLPSLSQEGLKCIVKMTNLTSLILRCDRYEFDEPSILINLESLSELEFNPESPILHYQKLLNILSEMDMIEQFEVKGHLVTHFYPMAWHDGRIQEVSSLAALYRIHERDFLSVYDSEGKVLFSDAVSINSFDPDHTWFPKSVDKKTFVTWFENNYKCELKCWRPKPNKKVGIVRSL